MSQSGQAPNTALRCSAYMGPDNGRSLQTILPPILGWTMMNVSNPVDAFAAITYHIQHII